MKRKGDPLGGEPSNKLSRLDESAIQPQTIAQTSEQDPGLPLELWLMILERLASKADLQRINRVCKQFNELINANYRLWYALRWPEKDYDYLSKVVDASFYSESVRELLNGDIAVLLPNGQFSLFSVAQSEERLFAGHVDPDNLHIARHITAISSLHHNQLATCAEDGIYIWNRLTAERVQHLPPQHPNDKPFKLLRTAYNDLISASLDGSIYLYASEQGPVTQFEYDDTVKPEGLKDIRFWRNEIVAEFSNVIVSWNNHGRQPVTSVVIQVLRQQLLDQMNKILVDPKILSLGLITDNDRLCFANPVNEGLAFKWDFSYIDHLIEVVLNKTFSFLLDPFNGKLPVFLGVYGKRAAVRDAQRNCYVLRELTDDRYEALFDWSSQEGAFKSRQVLSIPEPVKYYFIQLSGAALFVLYDNRVVWWDVKLNISRYFLLATPEVSPQSQELYEYGGDDWTFKMLMTKELLGLHKRGITMIWDFNTGQIKQHFMPDYLCDPSYKQHVLQMRNRDLLIQRRDEGELNEEGDWVNKQDHMCIYRFLQPTPTKPDDAISTDFAIISSSPKR